MTDRERLVACLNEALKLAKDGPPHFQPQARYDGWANQATMIMASWASIDPQVKTAILSMREGWTMELQKLSKSEQIAHLADVLKLGFEEGMPPLPPGPYSQLLAGVVDDVDWGEIAAVCLNGRDV